MASGLFRKVKTSFLYVGHTHEDIDQSFSVISRDLKRSDCLSPQELTIRIRNVFRNDPNPPHVQWLHAVWDYKAWFEGPDVPYGKVADFYHLDPKLAGFKYKNCFRTTLCDGRVLTHIREWAQQEDNTYETPGCQVIKISLNLALPQCSHHHAPPPHV